MMEKIIYVSKNNPIESEEIRKIISKGYCFQVRNRDSGLLVALVRFTKDDKIRVNGEEIDIVKRGSRIDWVSTSVRVEFAIENIIKAKGE